MTVRKKTVLIVLLATAALFAVLLMVAPMLVNLDRYRPEVVDYLQRETGKPVAIRRLQLTFFPTLSIRADDVSLGNPPGYPPGDLLSARHIYAQLQASALWHRQVVIASLVLDRPVISLLTDGRGHWNYQYPGSAGVSPALPLPSIGKLISGGKTGVAAGLPRHISCDFNGRWRRKAAATCFFRSPVRPRAGGTPVLPAVFRTTAIASGPFTLKAISKLETRGALITVARFPAAGPGEAGEGGGPAFLEARGVSSTLENVDLRALAAGTPLGLPPVLRSTGHGPLLASFVLARVAGAATLMSVSDPAESGIPAATGDVRADAVRIGAVETSNVKSKLRAASGQVFFEGLGFDAYDGHVTGQASLSLSGPAVRFHASVQLTGLDVAKLLTAFPEGAGKITGKMDSRLDVSGEVSAGAPARDLGLDGTGEVTIHDGRLPTLRLNQNLVELARIGALGPGSRDPAAFSRFSADLNLAGQRITSRKINIVGNGINIEGYGTLDLASADSLDYRGTARIDAKRNPLTTIIAGLSGATYAHGQLVFPFALSGNLRTPRFVLKTEIGNP